MRRQILRLALAALVGIVGGPALAAQPPLVFAVVSGEGSQTVAQSWTPFLNDMQAAIGAPIKPVFASNYTSVIEAMRFKQADVGWFTNLSGLEAVRRSGGEVFARSTKPTGPDGYQALILVKKGSGLTLDRILKCDRTLDFGMGDPKSTSGTLAPKTYLFTPRGLDPAKCFKTVRSASHEANLLAVSAGMVDAATNNTGSMRILASSENAAARRAVAGVEVIWRSPLIPENPVVWRKDLDPAMKARLTRFLFHYGVGAGPEAERQRAVLARIQTGPFKPATNAHLIPVREMEASEALNEARNSGDKAAISRAQAVVDGLKRERAALPKS